MGLLCDPTLLSRAPDALEVAGKTPCATVADVPGPGGTAAARVTGTVAFIGVVSSPAKELAESSGGCNMTLEGHGH